MNGMFEKAKKFDADLSGWDVSRVRYLACVFQSAESFQGRGLEHWQPLSANRIFDGALTMAATGARERILSVWKENRPWCHYD